MDLRPTQLLAQAKERFQLQDYFGAIMLLEDLIADGRAFADAHHLLGLANHMVGRTTRALESFEHALQLNPRYVEAHIHRGIVLAEVGRAREAEEEFRAARQSGGGDRGGVPAHHAAKLANLHADLGDAYSEAGALTYAIEQYDAALRLGPDFHDLRYRLGRLLMDAGRTLEAREALEAVVAARPESADALAALGLACYLSGDAASAREAWQTLARAQPGDPRPRAYLAMLDRGGGV